MRKGEKGIAIYAPMRFRVRDTTPDAADDSATATRLGFRIAYVFGLAIARLQAFLVGHNVELENKLLPPGLMGCTNSRRITCGLGQPAPLASGVQPAAQGQ